MRRDIPQKVMRRRRAWTLIADLISPWGGFLPYDREPKAECRVEVVRISDGHVAVSYDYDQELRAIDHMLSLRSRAESMSIADFDRDLGLGEAW